MEFCTVIDLLFRNYFKLIISCICLLLNLACIVCFHRATAFKTPKKQPKNFNCFKYLLVKSYCDAYLLAHNIVFGVLHITIEPLFYQSMFICVMRIVFEEFLDYIAELVSMFCAIASVFNHYRTILNKFQQLNKVSFWIKVSVMFFYAAAFYSYKFFQFNCIQIEPSNHSFMLNTTKSHMNKTLDYNFKYTFEYKSLFFIHSMVRDGICLVIILVLNILVMIYVRDKMNKKNLLFKILSELKHEF